MGGVRSGMAVVKVYEGEVRSHDLALENERGEVK